MGKGWQGWFFHPTPDGYGPGSWRFGEATHFLREVLRSPQLVDWESGPLPGITDACRHRNGSDGRWQGNVSRMAGLRRAVPSTAVAIAESFFGGLRIAEIDRPAMARDRIQERPPERQPDYVNAI